MHDVACTDPRFKKEITLCAEAEALFFLIVYLIENLHSRFECTSSMIMHLIGQNDIQMCNNIPSNNDNLKLLILHFPLWHVGYNVYQGENIRPGYMECGCGVELYPS